MRRLSIIKTGEQHTIQKSCIVIISRPNSTHSLVKVLVLVVFIFELTNAVLTGCQFGLAGLHSSLCIVSHSTATAGREKLVHCSIPWLALRWTSNQGRWNSSSSRMLRPCYRRASLLPGSASSCEVMFDGGRELLCV